MLVQGKLELMGNWDTDVVFHLREASVFPGESPAPVGIVPVGCGGKQTSPLGVCDVAIGTYGFPFEAPVLIVEGKGDSLIVSMDVLQPFIRQLKSNDCF